MHWLDVRYGITGNTVEERRVLNVGAGIVPGVNGSTRSVNCVPQFVAVDRRIILFGKHLRMDRRRNGLPDFFSGWPKFFQEYIFPVIVLTDWLRR